MGEHGQGDVAVPGVPEADLVVVEADLVLARLEALLDRPAGTDDGDQLRERGTGRGVADEVSQLGGIGEGAANQQPVGGAGGVDQRPVVETRAFGALPTGEDLPGRAGQARHQSISAARAGLGAELLARRPGF